MELSELLTREQLEDAKGCCQNHDCDCAVERRTGGVPCICVQAAAQTALHYMKAAERYRGMLKRLEWIETEYIFAVCPECGGQTPHGHEEGCELAALLKESEGANNND